MLVHNDNAEALPLSRKRLYDGLMLLVDSKSCKVAVFVCVNERQNEKPSCGKVGGLDFYLRLKEKVRDSGLQNSHWITRTGCLGFCNPTGTAVAVFRAGKDPVWYNEVKLEQLETIWREIES